MCRILACLWRREIKKGGIGKLDSVRNQKSKQAEQWSVVSIHSLRSCYSSHIINMFSALSLFLRWCLNSWLTSWSGLILKRERESMFVILYFEQFIISCLYRGQMENSYFITFTSSKQPFPVRPPKSWYLSFLPSYGMLNLEEQEKEKRVFKMQVDQQNLMVVHIWTA